MQSISPTKTISIHASAREATSPPAFRKNLRHIFQSTPPRGRRRQYTSHQYWHGHYFNPRLREGGDTKNSGKNGNFSISIHASAREATISPDLSRGLRSFQSTPPRGRRRPLCRLGDVFIYISIHASAREATTENSYGIMGRNISIHASAREATIIVTPSNALDLFQSTPPRGRRRHRSSVHSASSDFNPRLREGGDWDCTDKVLAGIISIHASAREATCSRADFTGSCRFQSTPPRGRRQPSRFFFHHKCQISIHASAREATSFLAYVTF